MTNRRRLATETKTRTTGTMAMAINVNLLLGLGCAALMGCWEGNPCDPGQVVHLDQCVAAPVPPASPVDGGNGASPDAADVDSGAPLDTFGMTCASAADCAGGNAPVCGAPQLPVCTQILCQAGEANAGACPTGWQCVSPGGGNPSVCLKQ